MSLDDGCVLCWGHLHDLGMRLCSVFLGWCNDVRHVRATDVFGAFARCIWLRMYSRLSVGGLEYYIIYPWLYACCRSIFIITTI